MNAAFQHFLASTERLNSPSVGGPMSKSMSLSIGRGSAGSSKFGRLSTSRK